MSHPDRLLNCAVKHDYEPKSVLHIANAMDNALPTALTGNFDETDIPQHAPVGEWENDC